MPEMYPPPVLHGPVHIADSGDVQDLRGQAVLPPGQHGWLIIIDCDPIANLSHDHVWIFHPETPGRPVVHFVHGWPRGYGHEPEWSKGA